jgi:hypothetical protein
LRHPTAKIDLEKAREIRRLYKEGATQMELAARFGVAQSVISLTIRGNLHRDPDDVPGSCPMCGYTGTRGTPLAV